MSRRAAVLGTLHLDVAGVIDSDRVNVDREHPEEFLLADARLEIGGTISRVLTAASRYFDSVVGFAVAGDDAMAGLAEAMLEAERPEGVEIQLLTAPHSVTGSVFILHTRSGGRLLIGPKHAAKDRPPPDIAQRVTEAGPFSWIFFDGYCVLDREGRLPYLAAVKSAKKGGAFVCFDLLPHTIENRFSRDDVVELLADVDVLTANASTAASALDLVEFDYLTASDSEVAELGAMLIDQFGISAAILRFGEYGISRTMIRVRDEYVRFFDTSPEGLPTPGYGDALLMRDIVVIESVSL